VGIEIFEQLINFGTSRYFSDSKAHQHRARNYLQSLCNNKITIKEQQKMIMKDLKILPL
jgi:hypothetical protein